MWHPAISEKQSRVINDVKPYRLLSGPRSSGKTVIGLHTICHHLWTTKNANFSMVGRTLADNFDGGAWYQLFNWIMPQWVEGRESPPCWPPPEGWEPRKNPFGFEIVDGPKMDGLTHKMMAVVTNQYGGTSRIQLDSVKIETDKELERIFKGKIFSGAYVTEASNFTNPNLLKVLEETLRMPNLKKADHLIMLDTNPAPEGEESWIYKQLIEFPKLDEEQLLDRFINKSAKEEDQVSQMMSLKERQAKISVHFFKISDNMFITAEEKRAIWTRYCDNPDLLARFHDGLWVRSSTDSIFQDVFRPRVHVVGSADPDREDAEIMLPQEGCFQLGLGYDPGDMNNAWIFIEKAFRKKMVNGRLTDEDESIFKILDEVVFIGEALPNSEIVPLVMEKMDKWEKETGNTVLWRAISDAAAFDRYSKIHDRNEAMDVFVESGGRIELEKGPAKKNGSLEARVKLLRKLLFQGRIFFAGHCVKTIEMLNNLKKGVHAAVDPKSPHKHPFDALTYFLTLECWNEMEHAAIHLNMNTKPSAGVLSVRL